MEKEKEEEEKMEDEQGEAKGTKSSKKKRKKRGENTMGMLKGGLDISAKWRRSGRTPKKKFGGGTGVRRPGTTTAARV